MKSDIIVETKELSKIYTNGSNKKIALNHVNIKIKKGEFVCIVGTSGSGKSTLLNILGGLDQATEGEVIIGSTHIEKLDEERRTLFRRKNVGFVFQDYNLIPVLNTYENIMLPIELEDKKIQEEKLDLLLKILGILDKKYDLPNQLSGGQQQRVAIARALIGQPDLILADEPTGNLDSKTTHQVVGLLKQINQQLNQTIVLVTHNENIAKDCNHIIQIEDGRVRNEEE